jgi:transcription elongation factor GreA
MSELPTVSRSFQEAIEVLDTDRVEELWLEALEQSPIPYPELLEVRRLLWKAGQKNLALTLLELLAETLETNGNHTGSVTVLREMIRLGDKVDPEVVDRLATAFATSRSGSPSLEAVLDHAPIEGARKPLEVLEVWERWLDHDVGAVVEVVGQGVGRVTDLNLALESIKVDVGTRRPVTVQFAGVARFVNVLEEDDFRRLKVEDPDGLGERVIREPGESLVHLLESLGEPANVATIKDALDGLVSTEKWTSWWGKARSHPRIVTTGSGSRLRYSVSGSVESATDALLAELESSEPRKRLTVARRLAARGEDAAAAAVSMLAGSLDDLEKSEPGLAWETAALLDDLAGGEQRSAASRERLIEAAAPLQLLSGIQDRQARLQALDVFRSTRPEEWSEIWAEWLLHEQNPALLGRVAAELERARESDVLDAALEAVFRNHTEHPAQFIWACETMTEPDCPEPLRRRLTPSLLEKIPDTLSRPEFGQLRSRAKTLLDGGRAAVHLILHNASAQQASRFVSRISRISSVEPQRLTVLEQAERQRGDSVQEPEAPMLVASRAAVEDKQRELKQLLDFEIPKTLKGIQAAAAEGDLRENFEYHMLRDRQELLSAKAAKLQQELAVVQILEPGTADTSAVNIGTVIHFEGGGGRDVEPVTILGVWDADIDRRIFANGSGVAAGLLGRSPGDEVEIDGASATIVGIEPWTGD